MQIKVCDALCGFGKTSACINMMNERTDQKFIFVTQYLSEVERIKEGCASRSFVSPECEIDNRKTKLSNIAELVASGENIATTHALFVSYTDKIKDMIKDNHYILVLDEVVDVMTLTDLAKTDISILKDSKSVSEDNDGTIVWENDQYTDQNGRFYREMLMAKSKNLIRYGSEYFFWSIPPELFTCFEDVYVLTYLFNAQPLRAFFDVYGIGYELIGVKRDGDKFRFCDIKEMSRKKDLRGKIHVIGNSKADAIGESRSDLSYSWYRKAALNKESDALDRLKKNIYNVLRNTMHAKSDGILWSTFKDYKNLLAQNGYLNEFAPYNLRASNKYAHKRYLAYCVNNFPRPWELKYYTERGAKLDSDMYALSILIQWVFRSAIRNDEEVWIYIPSVRMRTLFLRWLDLLASGNDLKPVRFGKQRVHRGKRGRPRKNTNEGGSKNE